MAFLIAHGDLLWLALVACLTAVSLIGVRRGARMLAHRGALADLALRGESVGRLAPGRVVLRGRLRGGALASVSRGLYAETVVTVDRATAGAPYLELLDGTRVDFAAPVRVELGTRAAWPRAGWPAEAPAAAREPLAHAPGPVRYCAVADGDEVLVRGVARAATQADGYRGSAGAGVPWTLVGDRAEPLALAAVAPAIAPRPAHPFVMPLVGAGLAIVWAAALYGFGVAAIASGAPALGLATPGTRDAALRALRDRLPADAPQRPDVVAAIGDCAAAHEELAHGRYALAADAAADCPTTSDLAFTAMLAAGEYERAARASHAGHLQAHLTAAIAADRWLDAAADARMIARRLEDASLFPEDHAWASDYSCFDDFLRAQAGAADAFTYVPDDRLDTHTCKLLRAAARGEDLAVAALAAAAPTDRALRTQRWLAHQAVLGPGDRAFAIDAESPTTVLFALHTPAAARVLADPRRAYALALARSLAIGR